MKGNWPGLAQSRLWLICNQILIENERKFAFAGSELILVDLQSNSNSKSEGLVQSRFLLICDQILIEN